MSVIRVAPPQLRTLEAEAHRSATWLELFYDLVFVVAVAVLAARLLEDVTGAGLASYFGYFALIWWLWASHTYYADRYDTDDLVYRLIAAAQMVAVVVVASSLSPDEASSTTAFAIGYAICRVLLLIMYWRAYRHVAETRSLTKGYLIGFGLAALVWTSSALVPQGARIVVWAVALVIDLATPWVMRQEQAKVPLDVSHLPERFGLFTILVLGESIAAVVAGLGHRSWELVPMLAAALAVALATALWWLYFDNTHGEVVRRDASVRKTWRPTVWIYTHLPLAAALVGSGVAMERVVVEAGSGPMPAGDRWLLVGSVSVVLASLAVIHLASSGGSRLDRLLIYNRIIGIPALILIGLLSSLNAPWIALGVLGVCVAEVVGDMATQAEVVG
ncbi:MAG TPA: low temperature requirement protein A [Acidimicrobiia bacterium]|nr:low temperature requirement protein A [Acidimicrobiia bacterium]